jgi:hypothetical protein
MVIMNKEDMNKLGNDGVWIYKYNGFWRSDIYN